MVWLAGRLDLCLLLSLSEGLEAVLHLFAVGEGLDPGNLSLDRLGLMVHVLGVEDRGQLVSLEASISDGWQAIDEAAEARAQIANGDLGTLTLCRLADELSGTIAATLGVNEQQGLAVVALGQNQPLGTESGQLRLAAVAALLPGVPCAAGLVVPHPPGPLLLLALGGFQIGNPAWAKPRRLRAGRVWQAGIVGEQPIGAGLAAVGAHPTLYHLRVCDRRALEAEVLADLYGDPLADHVVIADIEQLPVVAHPPVNAVFVVVADGRAVEQLMLDRDIRRQGQPHLFLKSRPESGLGGLGSGVEPWREDDVHQGLARPHRSGMNRPGFAGGPTC
ncbi:hypothetical protein ACFQY5_36935 [Paeniroseomonas aquatica]|uniref:hypothetical protein n=1 Tax=Paeniroseomonas aquatica TaxID=373043 RepID=UPI0036065446